MEATIASLFSDSSSSGYRLLAALALAAVLMLVDHRTDYGQWIRTPAGYITGPIQYLAYLPVASADWVAEQSRSLADLREENSRLARQAIVLEHKAQRLAVLEAENTRLRELLDSSDRIEARVRVAEIIGIEPDPNRHEVLINLGQNDEVSNGQAVLDAHGLMGQVVNVGPLTSRVLLITDATHAGSVKVNRNGVRSILAGTGHPDRLELLYLPDTADVKPGDLLVSTGLGRRFPAGYPVAEVTQVEADPSRPFLQVRARPTARIDRASHVLLVSQGQSLSAPAADAEAAP